MASNWVWRLQTVTCPERATSMRSTEDEVKARREGIIETRIRLDALTRTQSRRRQL
jgi:hypothetical protein